MEPDTHVTVYDMASSLKADAGYKELAAVVAAMIDSEPAWIPEIVFGAPNLNRDEESYQTPIVMVQGGNEHRVHIGGLLLFAKSKEQVLLDDLAFEWKEDGSEVVWHQVLNAAFEDDRVKERLATIDPDYAGPFDSEAPLGNKLKVMALMEMLSGIKPEVTENSAHWKSSGDGGNAGTDMKAMKNGPAVVFTKDQKLQPLRLDPSEAGAYFLMDATALPSGNSGQEDIGERLDFDDFEKKFLWSVRLPQKPIDNN